MSRLSYVYQNHYRTLQQEQMYQGEKIAYKNENIKWEDE